MNENFPLLFSKGLHIDFIFFFKPLFDIDRSQFHAHCTGEEVQVQKNDYLVICFLLSYYVHWSSISQSVFHRL